MNELNTEIKFDIMHKLNLMVEESDYFQVNMLREKEMPNNAIQIKNESSIVLSPLDNDFLLISYPYDVFSCFKKFLPFLKKQLFFYEYQSTTNKILAIINENKILIDSNIYSYKESIDDLFSLNRIGIKFGMGAINTDLGVIFDLVYNITLKSLTFRIDYKIFHNEDPSIKVLSIMEKDYELERAKEIINNFYKENFFKEFNKTIDELSEEEKTLIKMSYY